jgi:hypothetical protein
MSTRLAEIVTRARNPAVTARAMERLFWGREGQRIAGATASQVLNLPHGSLRIDPLDSDVAGVEGLSHLVLSGRGGEKFESIDSRAIQLDSFLETDTSVEPAVLDELDSSMVQKVDHVVVFARRPAEEAAASYEAMGLGPCRLIKPIPVRRATMAFFRLGRATLEIVCPDGEHDATSQDRLWGVAWKVGSVADAAVRLAAQHADGWELGDVKDGVRPGSKVLTIRNAPMQIPTILISGGGKPGGVKL